ncbi:hypothetical protein AAMO2058_001490600, partial [Amorphochlora amoebiformis]
MNLSFFVYIVTPGDMQEENPCGFVVTNNVSHLKSTVSRHKHRDVENSDSAWTPSGESQLDIKSPQAGNSTIDGERFGTEKQALTDEKETKVHVQDSLPVLTVAQGNP